MEWKQWQGKRIFVVLKSVNNNQRNITYTGTVKEVNDHFILIVDKYGMLITINTDEIKIIKEEDGGKPKSKREFKMPKGWKKTLKKSKKKSGKDKILVLYLRKNGRVEGPLLKTYSDNVVTIDYKAYDLDPRAIWDWGKYKIYVVKEIDRRPVSNLNYREIKRRGDLTDSDEILIKATMRAIQSGIKKPINKGMVIVIIVIIVIALAFFFTQSGPG